MRNNTRISPSRPHRQSRGCEDSPRAIEGSSSGLTLVCRLPMSHNPEFVETLVARPSFHVSGALVVIHENEWTGQSATAEIWSTRQSRELVASEVEAAYAVFEHGRTTPSIGSN